jgi:hypothetical protein
MRLPCRKACPCKMLFIKPYEITQFEIKIVFSIKGIVEAVHHNNIFLLKYLMTYCTLSDLEKTSITKESINLIEFRITI